MASGRTLEIDSDSDPDPGPREDGGELAVSWSMGISSVLFLVVVEVCLNLGLFDRAL